MNKILCFIKKEFIQYKRNILLIIMNIIVMPFIQFFLYGTTISYDVKNIPMVILNQDQSLVSLKLCDKFQNTTLFNLKKYIFSRNEIENIMKKGEAQIVLVIPHDFQINMNHNKPASLQLIVDGTDSNTAIISLNNASSIIKSFSQELIINKISRHQITISKSPSIESLPQILYNPRQKSITDMAPRIIAAILLTQILVFGVNAFVVEKESGTIKQLHLSTLNIKEYLISKALPIFIIGTVMFTFMIISSVFVFKMPIRGNILAVFLSTFLYFLALLSLSFCTVIFTNTSLQAYLALSFIFQIPFILFSGFFFPIHNMPDIFQLISLLNPLRHYLEIIVGLTLKGATIFDLQAQFIMLGLLSFSFLSFGFLFFKKIFE